MKFKPSPCVPARLLEIRDLEHSKRTESLPALQAFEKDWAAVVQPGNAQRSVAADGGRGGLLKIMARVALLQMVVDQCLRSAKIGKQSNSSQSNFRLLG